jgi:hypothetical protein
MSKTYIEAKGYRRLPGRGSRNEGWLTVTATSSRLYLGDDHLFCVDRSTFFEDYRRFYFGDIQAITLRKTDRGKIWNAVLGVLCGLSAISALIFSSGISEIAAMFFAAFAGLCLVLLGLNVARGPTCKCHLLTAVQMEVLPSLNRLRVANRALALLRPMIEQAQGTLARDEIAERLRSLPVVLPGAPVHGNIGGNSTVQEAAVYAGGFHTVLFCLLLADSVFTAFDMVSESLAPTLIASLVTLGVAFFCVVGLVRQQGSSLARTVKTLTWMTLVYVGLGIVAGYAILFAVSVRDPGLIHSEWEFLRVAAEISPFDSPFIMGAFLVGIFLPLVLGLTGLVALRRSQHGLVMPWGRHSAGLKRVTTNDTR